MHRHRSGLIEVAASWDDPVSGGPSAKIKFRPRKVRRRHRSEARPRDFKEAELHVARFQYYIG